MALQLMAMGDDELFSTLAPEDDFWRNCLHIPHRLTVEKALKQSLSARGSKNLGELDIAWREVWKPELLRWFILIDEDFLSKKPELAKAKGRYWHPLVDEFLALEEAEMAKPKRAPAKKTSARKNSLNQGENPETASPKQRQQRAHSHLGRKKTEKLFVPEWDYPVVRITEKTVQKCWDVPVDREARLQIWRDAVYLLTGGNESQESGARQFIGKLVKDYGESKVAKAVADLIVRPVKPADPKSFLRKQLKNATEGSEKVQKARLQRIKVPL